MKNPHETHDSSIRASTPFEYESFSVLRSNEKTDQIQGKAIVQVQRYQKDFGDVSLPIKSVNSADLNEKTLSSREPLNNY